MPRSQWVSESVTRVANAMVGIGSDKNIFKHVFRNIVQNKFKRIFSGGTLHTSDARQACSTDSKIALRVSGISIKHETTWNTPGLDSRNVWQSHSYFQLNMKHETAWNTPGLDSRKVGQSHSYFQSNMKPHERFLVCIQEGWTKLLIFSENECWSCKLQWEDSRHQA